MLGTENSYVFTRRSIYREDFLLSTFCEEFCKKTKKVSCMVKTTSCLHAEDDTYQVVTNFKLAADRPLSVADKSIEHGAWSQKISDCGLRTLKISNPRFPTYSQFPNKFVTRNYGPLTRLRRNNLEES
jgi:hypothetical protein